MLGDLRGKLVEAVGQLDLVAQRAERFRDRAAALHRDESGDGTAGALDDHVLATLGEIDQPRELALSLVHPDADHGRTIARA